MFKRSLFKPLLAALLLAPVFSAAALAQTAPKPPAPVGTEPQSTSASYGDWTVRCDRIADGDKTVKICEAVGVIRNQNQNAVAQAIVSRASKAEPLKLTAQAPNNVLIPSVVKFTPGGKDAKPWELGLRRATPIGVFADLALSDAQLLALHGPAEAGALEFTDAAGRAVSLPLSLRGLPQALDALARE
jgi:invasion protein IalB